MKISRYTSSITDTLYILGTNNSFLPNSSPSSQLTNLNNGTSNKSISRSKLYRLIVWLCIGFIFIVLFRLILTVTYFPYGTSLGDLLINQGYLSPNTQINSYAHKRIKVRSANVTLLGMGKDVADNLDSVLKQMEIVGQLFDSYQMLLVEGGSKDDTVALIRKYVENRKRKDVLIRFISTPPAPAQEGGSGPFSDRNMPREGRLAIARNLALDELSTMPLTDYVIMIDMDIIGWDINGILDSFSLHVPVPVMSHENGMNNSGFSADVNIDRDNDSGRNSNRIDRVSDRLSDISSDISDSGIKENYKHKSKWDVICSNGIILHGVYRDIYAFRVDGLNTNHHWAGQDGADYGLVDTDLAKRRQNLNLAKQKIRAIMSGGSAYPGSYYQRPLLPVDSCFGGLAIYRYEALRGCRYSFRYSQPPHMLECEHVLFHQCIREQNGAKLFANPNMKLWYGHDPLRLPTTKIYKGFIDWIMGRDS